MPKFFYVFMYELPGVAAMDKRMGMGWDESMHIVIEAETKELAKEWGDTLAKEYVDIIYQNPDDAAKALKLTPSYDGEIEEGELHPWIKQHFQSIPVVRYQERPDLVKWVQERYGPGPY